jgi:cell division protein FtsI (penicillin-binding protein 3)
MLITRWTRVRVVVCGVVLATLFLAVGKRAYTLQVRDAERLRGMAEEQYLREIELPPRRGRILDRNGAELASTADVDSIYCNPRQLPDVRDAARRLARALGLDRAELEKKLSQRRFFAWVKRKVTPDEVTAVKALGLPGLAFAREPRRFYPNRTLAATIMGHAGSEGNGLEGIELALDKQLRGTSSSVQGMRDALGRDIALENSADGVGDGSGTSAGSDVVLTIDRYLTFITERALAAGAAEHHAKAAIAMMMDPHTGELLAMASVPTYNPNDPQSAADAGARNRAITDAFEPGSTMKTFTIAAALDAGAVRPDDHFDCMMGRLQVGKYTVHDTHPHGSLSVAEVFKFSSNIGATKIARRLGKERLADALSRFGFGRRTGLGLPGEQGGVVRSIDKWGDIGFANVSFGQGMTATPLQIVTAMSAIASGGIYHPPRIVARVARPDGTIVPDAMPEQSGVRIISEKAAREMTSIMVGVTEVGGTARAAALDGYAVAGKTGTAQKVSGGHYDSSKWVSSFIGFAPAEQPRVAIAVMVDEPQGAHLGGAVAAPIFKDIAEQTLRYLHVPSSQPLASKKGTPGARGGDGKMGAGAMAALTAAMITTDADERPGSDVADVAVGADIADITSLGDAGDAPEGPAAGRADDSDREVTVATGEGDDVTNGEGATSRPVMVPDFTGLTVAAVLRAANRNGVELALGETGAVSGVAVRQSPPPGMAPSRVVCKVTFGRPD